MPTVKQIVCLANSRKLSGRCIAGKEWSDGVHSRWIRPVSDREGEEVSEYERQYEDGSDPRLLDIIKIPLLEPKPKLHQRENWLLDPNFYWEKNGYLRWRDLAQLTDPAKPLWINGQHTSNGKNDRIPRLLASELDCSLRLVQIDGLTLSVFKPGEAFGNPKRRVQGRFYHDGIEYHLWVTDPVYERDYLARSDGKYRIDEKIFLTVSLGESFRDNYHKLIAAVIPCNEESAT